MAADAQPHDRPDATGRPAVPGERRQVGGRDLPVAIASGVLLAGLFIGSLFWHPAVFTGVVVVLACVATVETSRVLRTRGRFPAVPVLLVTVVVGLVGTYLADQAGQVVAVVVLFIGAVTWQLADRRRRDTVEAIGTTLLLGLWLPVLATYAVLLANRPEDGPAAALGTIGAAVLTDVGGFFVGVRFGRHKIAPSVSPAKSWEGLIGGLVTSAVLAAVILPLVGDLFDVVSAAALGLAAGFAGFVGDLVESMVKRDLGVKDLGTIIPGHGGIMDRVDGILVALPVGYYVLELLT